MTETAAGTGVLERFAEVATVQVRRILTENAAPLAAAADAVVAAARSGRIVYSAGAGHSVAGVIETFFRAGGLAFVRPLWHPDILPLRGAERSTRAERTEGMGAAVVADAGITAGDVVVVFSTSGINVYPVEVARSARALGATVVAVTSRAASEVAPLRAGARLHDLVDIVVDTLVLPGDATWPPEQPRTAPLSSVANALVWDAILVLALETDPALPLWESANIGRPTSTNADLTDRYASSIPEIRLGMDDSASG
jgi:uncharacterized phosphosugar-binding protein